MLAAQPAPKKAGKHHREPWDSGCPAEILVHCRWQQLRGDYKVSAKQAEVNRQRYKRAKSHFDLQAAADIVDELISPATVDRIIDQLIKTNLPPLIVVPHPEYDPDEGGHEGQITNALPFAIANYLAAELDCETDAEIIEVARPGRTKLRIFERFLWQPRFEGSVRLDRAYILVDDTCTLGGTFAALRSHIVGNGGTVIALTALSRGDGTHARFPIASRTRDVLLSIYGPEFSTLWTEEIGHDEKSLTEGEGSFLEGWGKEKGSRDPATLLRALRDRLAETAGKGG